MSVLQPWNIVFVIGFVIYVVTRGRFASLPEPGRPAVMPRAGSETRAQRSWRERGRRPAHSREQDLRVDYCFCSSVFRSSFLIRTSVHCSVRSEPRWTSAGASSLVRL